MTMSFIMMISFPPDRTDRRLPALVRRFPYHIFKAAVSHFWGGGELTELQEEYLGDVMTSSMHLLSLINGILDLSKVEAGKEELNLSQVSLKRLLDSSLTMMGRNA
jgi:signal transduction histidine kinase